MEGINTFHAHSVLFCIKRESAGWICNKAPYIHKGWGERERERQWDDRERETEIVFKELAHVIVEPGKAKICMYTIKLETRRIWYCSLSPNWQNFLFLGKHWYQLIAWGLPTSRGLIRVFKVYWFKCESHLQISSRWHPVVFGQVSGYCGLAKLIHTINCHTSACF